MLTARRTYFFVIFSVLLAIPVFFGFMPTFFLRATFQPADGHGPEGLPPLILIHGIFMTTWVLLVIIQTSLVASRKINIHKRLGWLSAAVAFGGWLTALLVVPKFAHRLMGLGIPAEVLREALVKMYWTDVISLVLFPAFVIGGVLARNRPEVHKRLMIYSTLTLLSPATGRMTRMIAPTDEFGGINWPLSVSILMAFALLPMFYELMNYRKAHKVTWLSIGVLTLSHLAMFALSATEWGKDVSALHFID